MQRLRPANKRFETFEAHSEKGRYVGIDFGFAEGRGNLDLGMEFDQNDGGVRQQSFVL